MRNQVVSATEFKAKCLGYLAEIDEHGGTITITKRGRPMAKVTRTKRKPFRNPEGLFAGKIKIVGDIVNADDADLWEVVTNPDRVLNPEKYR